jgi:hypothetical protein
MRPRRVLSLALLVALAAAAPAAHAATPPPTIQSTGNWVLTNAEPTPIQWFQGLTHTAADDFLFVGINQGGYRASSATLQQLAANNALIPPAVQADPGFNHIGDPTYDRGEGGRLLLPLECYVPGRPNGGNTCGMGGIGVADPTTLTWRYWVRLDPADIPKAMWAEVSPDGSLLWTSSGSDLLAYATADISPAHAATSSASAPIKPVRRLVGAVPPSGVTGGVFVDGRLFLAGELNGLLQIQSVDLKKGSSRVELTLPGVGAEAEGLDLLDARGGVLHWLLTPFGSNGPATFPGAHTELLSFIPRRDARLRLTVTPKRLQAGVAGTLTASVQLVFAGSAHPAADVTVSVAGLQATTDAQGLATLTITPPAGVKRLQVTAGRPGLRDDDATVRIKKR